MTVNVVSLTPAYDLLNSTIVLGNAQEESALPLKGKKKKLSKETWIDYYCKQHLELNTSQIDSILEKMSSSLPEYLNLIEHSYLSLDNKEDYKTILYERCKILGLQTAPQKVIRAFLTSFLKNY